MNNKSLKLKTILNLQEFKTNKDEISISPEEKKQYIEVISSFSKLAPSIYRTESLDKVTNHLSELIRIAEYITLSETEDWFDRVTVQRHMKQMNESFKIFEKTVKEISILQQRLEAAYEDIGNMLNKYYEIKDVNINEIKNNTNYIVKGLKKI